MQCRCDYIHDKGEFIAAKTSWFHSLPQPQEVEAFGLKEVIA
jgi:hypothetical protein